MAQNYVLLETIELNQSAASVTFNNIPQSGYTDLKIVVSARTNAGNGSDQTLIKFNGSTTGYSAKLLGGTGSAAASANLAQYAMPNDTTSQTANTFNNGEIYIPNYAGSNNKSYSAEGVQENNGTAAYVWMTAGLWSDASGITIIELYPNSDSYVAGSTFSLYGLAAVGTTPVIGPKAFGGNIVANDGTYWYHAFLSSGTFTPATGLSCDVLVVAGGGSGGAAPRANFEVGGGGGAGGVLGFSAQGLTATNYSVTIGAGGTGASEAKGTSGSNTQFAALTACIGGGAGAGAGGGLPSAGGSGGGGSNWQWSTGGAGTTGQGFRGGNAYAAPNASGGGGAGGGGAGAQGVDKTGTTVNGTNGGTGVSTYTDATWLSAGLSATGIGVSGLIAGGGGGGGGESNGTGGTANGGGGAGATYTANVNGTAGTRGTGGGGGGSNGNAGGNGGSGVVIIRYPIA